MQKQCCIRLGCGSDDCSGKNRIGFLAPEGTFTHEAAGLRRCSSSEEVGFSGFNELIEGVKSGLIDEAIVPIENLLIGGVGVCLDSIIRANGDLKIKAEFVLPICQQLIGLKEMAFSEITKVVSIYEAVGQCRDWLNKNLPAIPIEHISSTALAVKDLPRFGKGAVAIGSEFAAKLYARRILQRDIHDNKENATYFLVLSKEDEEKETGDDKTSLIFSVDNKAGALVRVLNVLDALDINMIKIESRPSKVVLNEYVFWIDIEGHRNTGKIKEALKVIEGKTKFFKNLGSYPKARR